MWHYVRKKRKRDVRASKCFGGLSEEKPIRGFCGKKKKKKKKKRKKKKKKEVD